MGKYSFGFSSYFEITTTKSIKSLISDEKSRELKVGQFRRLYPLFLLLQLSLGKVFNRLVDTEVRLAIYWNNPV